MAYMRDPFYVWSDGENLHIHDQRTGDYGSGDDVTIPNKVFEELTAMYFLRMTEKEREKAIKRAYKNHGGNFGCEGVAKHLGKPSGYDMVVAVLDELEADPLDKELKERNEK